MGRLFDRIVVVDWSANSTPKRGADSIWIATYADDTVDVDTVIVETENVATRNAAVDRIVGIGENPGRSLIGVDFSLGFPAGTAHALGLDGVPWEQTWNLLAREITDGSDNANNRFTVASELNARIGSPTRAGPFWGCPASQQTSTLTSTKVPSGPLGEWRTVELAMRERGQRPFSAWQLLGAGSVGSQSLLGIAALRGASDEWHRRGIDVDVWPFTSGLCVPARSIVVAEVWPSLLDLPDTVGRVRDDLQVETLARHLADLDLRGRLAELFAPDVDEPERLCVEHEEGWVLGA